MAIHPVALIPDPDPKATGRDDMRDANCWLVYAQLRAAQRISHRLLAEQTRLAPATISTLVQLLVEAGLARREETTATFEEDHARLGRRRTPIAHRAKAGHVVAVDIGRMHLRIAIADLEAELYEPTCYSRTFDLADGSKQVLHRVAQDIRQHLHDHAIPLDPEHVLGIGVGMPSPVDVKSHHLVTPPFVGGWEDLDVAQILGEELHLPIDVHGRFAIPICVDNDANLGALGVFSRYGPFRSLLPSGVEDFLYVKIGSGIDAGLILHGMPYRGNWGGAGQLGHTRLDPYGPPCSCGHRGCLETVAGAAAVTKASGLEMAGRTPRDLADDIAEAALRGEARPRAAIARAAEALGSVLAEAVNLLNPAAIVLDGSSIVVQTAAAGDETLFVQPIRDQIHARAMPILGSRDLKVLVAPPDSHAIIRGGIYIVLAQELRSFVLTKVRAVAAGRSQGTVGDR